MRLPHPSQAVRLLCMFLLRSLSVRFVRVLGGFSYSPRVKLKHLSINQPVAGATSAISLTFG